MPGPPERSNTKPVRFKGPFDDYPGEDDEKRRLNAFLKRTGLHDYERFIRIGAFLARRHPGGPQVEYVQEIRRQEGAARSNSQGESIAQQDSNHEPTETANKQAQEEYEDKILLSEGYTGKWFRLRIFFRQSWRVLALVGCCSLGAVIQGWDETAINGGGLDKALLRS